MYALLFLALISFNSSAYILVTSCTNMQLDTQVWILQPKLDIEMEAPYAQLVFRKMSKVNSLILGPCSLMCLVPVGLWREKIKSGILLYVPALGAGIIDMVNNWRWQQVSQLVTASKHYSASWDSQKVVACCSYMPSALQHKAVAIGIMALRAIPANQGFTH